MPKTKAQLDADITASLARRLPVVINAHRIGSDTMYIEWFAVDKARRGKGVGRKAYDTWERKLPRAIKQIRLHAADSGEGPSTGFWESLGFDRRWSEAEIDEAVEEGANRYELEQELTKKRGR